MKLGKALYYGDFVIAPAAAIAATILALSGRIWDDAPIWAAAFAAGAFVWTFIEYAVHAWVYHRLPWFEQAHEAHHAEPKALIGAPSFLIVGILLALGFAPWAVLGTTICGGIAGGLMTGYLVYIVVHHTSHHAKPMRLLRAARLRHMSHHYRGGGGDYGVTTVFWDRVFSTGIEGPSQVQSLASRSGQSKACRL